MLLLNFLLINKFIFFSASLRLCVKCVPDNYLQSFMETDKSLVLTQRRRDAETQRETILKFLHLRYRKA